MSADRSILTMARFLGVPHPLKSLMNPRETVCCIFMAFFFVGSNLKNLIFENVTIKITWGNIEKAKRAHRRQDLVTKEAIAPFFAKIFLPGVNFYLNEQPS